MFSNTRLYALALTLSYLLPSASARVIWIPEELNPLADRSLHDKRETSTCGGDASLSQCPSNFPSSFCCATGTKCLHINTTSTVFTAICCPAGQGCTQIGPVYCDPIFQNATQMPSSQLHSDPPQRLDTCGTGCCPMGYACRNDQCFAKVTPPPTSSSLSSSSTPNPTSRTSTTSTPEPTKDGSPPSADRSETGAKASGPSFSGASFAAGLLPGLALGALIAALLILCCIRKKRRSSELRYSEKRKSRETLTDLGTLHPTTHGRSISEPSVDASMAYRTDFLRSTPQRATDNASNDTIGNSVGITAADGTPANRTPKLKAIFSRSPFMNQTPPTPQTVYPPVPAHLKRGTLSFTISPVRALKKQKSMHSLRRQMTQHSGLSRSGSTETIQVLMPSNEPYTPDRPPQIPENVGTLNSAKYQPPQSASTWNTTSISSSDDRHPGQTQVPYASSSRYPSPQAYNTPTRPPMSGRAGGAPAERGFLASPYIPRTQNASSGKAIANTGEGLRVPCAPVDTRRDTTFAAMMERVGVRKSDLIMGTGRKS